jgi:dihydroorotase
MSITYAEKPDQGALMAAQFDLVLANGTIVTHQRSAPGDIGIRQGRIAELGNLSRASARRTIDCAGLHILPGVIDTQVHFREPGLTHKEDLETGSRAAVMGGVTAVFEMPNTRPPTISAETLAAKLRAAQGRMHCDYAFYVGGTRDNVASLSQLETLPGCCGVKVFLGSSTGELLVDGEHDLLEILRRIARRAAFHSEDEGRLKSRLAEQRSGDPSSHSSWRDAETALRSTERLLRLARRTGKRVHVLHVSTAVELPLLAASKDLASVEVTPHHLTLSAPEAYQRLGTCAQMNPPIRDASHRDALWAALRDGTVDILGSDHAPHTLAEKSEAYPKSPSGMPGVQTLVPIMLDHVNSGRLSLERFVELTSSTPARLFQIAAKGLIEQGYDADFTIVDIKARRVITNQWIESRCGWTPYDGARVTGWPMGTIIRGRLVVWDGQLLSAPSGQPIQFTGVRHRSNEVLERI